MSALTDNFLPCPPLGDKVANTEHRLSTTDNVADRRAFRQVVPAARSGATEDLRRGCRIHRYWTCQCLMPLIMLCRSRSGVETGVSTGMWSAIALNIRSIVILARLAPTQ